MDARGGEYIHTHVTNATERSVPKAPCQLYKDTIKLLMLMRRIFTVMRSQYITYHRQGRCIYLEIGVAPLRESSLAIPYRTPIQFTSITNIAIRVSFKGPNNCIDCGARLF